MKQESSGQKPLRGVVVRLTGDSAERSHERASRCWIAERLAALLGYEFGGDPDHTGISGVPLYYVPNETLVGIDEARRLGISSERDFFGGVVPYRYVATKTITHPLVSPDAAAPEGWSHAFGTRVRDAVFPGFSAFSHADARVAARRVLERGSARIKLARGIGGFGQRVVRSLAEVDEALHTIDPDELLSHGLVVEWNLERVATCSVGRVRAAGLTASYCGVQHTTESRSGTRVYGGSDLTVVRGDYENLSRLRLTPAMRLAVEQARKYDAAASAEFPGFMASRRNYDVAQGVDGEGRRCSGVLEQSWRIGGASTAELAALVAFHADPDLVAVRACTREVHGRAAPPPHAIVHFSGWDEHVGEITKYSVLDTHADAARSP